VPQDAQRLLESMRHWLRTKDLIEHCRQLRPVLRQLAQPNIPQLKESEVVVIEVRRARTDLKSAVATYKKAHAMVVEDPEIMGGTPVIRETRVPVHLVAEMRRQGTSVEEILEGYPTITREHVALAELYVQAHPRRGPKTQTRLPRGARVIARKVYPLKRAS
jgi:uncharacterized protein (DUF433 family)